jgi:hypothetical protein
MINIADIAPAFAFLLRKGFVPGPAIDRPLEFGNAEVVLVGQRFSLRFERDRAQVFVDVGDNASAWYKLEYVLEFVDQAITQDKLGEPPQPVLMAELLDQNWDKVEALFRDPRAVTRLREFSQRRSAALLSRIFPGHRG